MVKKHLILCGIIIFVLLISILFLLFGIGIQYNTHSKYLPTEQGSALWVSEDENSWFEVDESETFFCLGELTIKGKKSVAYYQFKGSESVIISLCEKDFDFFNDTQLENNDSIIEYTGKCEFFKNEVIIDIDIECNKTITMKFKKTRDGSPVS